jgi:hypothetical protein
MRLGILLKDKDNNVIDPEDFKVVLFDLDNNETEFVEFSLPEFIYDSINMDDFEEEPEE